MMGFDGFDGYAMTPWMWVVGSLMMVLVWGALILFVIWAIRAVGGPRPVISNDALAVLKRRLAAGEITHDEYDKTRQALQS